MKMEQTECSEVLAYKIQTPGNHPEESIQHSERSRKVEIKYTLHDSQIYIGVFSIMASFHK
jgi:hypothetical protein